MTLITQSAFHHYVYTQMIFTQHVASLCPVALEYHIYWDIKYLTHWFIVNFLQVNTHKTQAMIMGKSQHNYENVHWSDKHQHRASTLKIPGVTLDCNLSFKQHASNMLKKVYAKIAALPRIRQLVPTDTLITLCVRFIVNGVPLF